MLRFRVLGFRILRFIGFRGSEFFGFGVQGF